jgi:hypothetical protein
VTPKRKERRPMPALRKYSIQSDCSPQMKNPAHVSGGGEFAA